MFERYEEEHCPTCLITHTFDFSRDRNCHFYFYFVNVFSRDVIEQTHEHVLAFFT